MAALPVTNFHVLSSKVIFPHNDMFLQNIRHEGNQLIDSGTRLQFSRHGNNNTHIGDNNTHTYIHSCTDARTYTH